MNAEQKADRPAALQLDVGRRTELRRQDGTYGDQHRTTGFDEDACNHQAAERKTPEENNAFEADMINSGHITPVQGQRGKRDDLHLQSAVELFTQSFPQPSCRREFDLDDPAILPQEGIQILQGLAGEDPESRERLKKQQVQLRDWSLQQQAELQTARQQQSLADHYYDKSRVKLDNRALQLQMMEEESKRSVAIATKDFNLALAAENRERKLREQQQEEVEVLNQLRGDLLCESRKQSDPGLARSRLQRDHYTPMTPRQFRELTDGQLRQAEEKRSARLQQHRLDLQQDRQRLDSARAALLTERHQARVTKQLRCTLDNTNAQLAAAHRAQKKYLEKEVYTNAPDESYFSQFNRNGR
ncbi:RIB43A-like with coiled-coils protein 2 [Denticeps clupeoides]|uniref:RIB43A domain with coiled-coils 2 n=1 Tax=Denticeps clupeoides TaxID=299321 RepID=A0AAY4CB55_9TELE|nr:RIB43A-like with coiled-coils protein 2 [Denticeps clupeoides]